MKQVKTARGRVIDMNALLEQNEKIKAIGNVPMNARGDRIDSKGKIIVEAKVMDEEQKKNAKKAESSSLNKAGTKATPKPVIEPITRRLRKRRNGTRYIEVSDSTSKEKKVYDVLQGVDDAPPYIEVSTKNGNTVVKMALKREDGSLYFEFENPDGSFDIVEL